MWAAIREKQGKIRWVFGLLAPHHYQVLGHPWSTATYHRANFSLLLHHSTYSSLTFKKQNQTNKNPKAKEYGEFADFPLPPNLPFISPLDWQDSVERKQKNQNKTIKNKQSPNAEESLVSSHKQKSHIR